MRKIKPIISIIVPVYNVEKYLERCIDSILAQTFTEFELILIDDGSTDKSGMICDYYESKDSRIKVYHIKNGGVSNARNRGIDIAQGDYLMFCDSDDYVERNWCSELYDVICESRNVLPISGVRVIYHFGEQKTEIVRTFQQKEVIAKSKYFETYKKGLSGGLWCKIYDRRIINENAIYFDNNVTRGEDLLFNLAYMNYMESFVTIPSITYHYVHSNVNSLINRYRKDLVDVTTMVYDAWQNFFIKNKVDSEQIKEFATHYYIHFLATFKNTFDERNHDHLFKKLIYNHQILNSKKFIECLELADTSKEDRRYIKLLTMKNYYFLWFAEQVIKMKKNLVG